jgi:hypothetical protein
MVSDTRELRTALEKWARDVEPRLLDGATAGRLLTHVARMEAMCASVKAALARRIEETDTWQRGGHRSAAHYLAAATGTSVGQASATLETAQQLEQLPDASEAFRTGRLSSAQVREIATAASDAPEFERTLVETALDAPFAKLRDACRRVRAAGTDELERHRRAHASRSLRSWTDAAGVWHLHGSGSPTDGAKIMARLDAETDRIFAEARKAGARESTEAYRFDALVRVAESSGTDHTPARAHVFVNVDAERLTAESGDATSADGICEIKGIGPVPVATARALMGDALLTILVKKGVDVTTIAHDGTKTMPIALRRAALAKDPECSVATCSAPTTEIHHVQWRSDGGEHRSTTAAASAAGATTLSTTTATPSSRTTTAPSTCAPP